MTNFSKISSFIQSIDRQKGFTLIKLPLSVLFLLVLLIGAIQLSMSRLNNTRALETINSLSQTIQQIDKMWAAFDNYVGLDIQSANAAGAFASMAPTRVNGVVQSVKNKFNTDVLLNKSENLPHAGAGGGFSLVHTGIPRSVCADLVTAGVKAGYKGIVIIPEEHEGQQAAELRELTLNATGAISGLPSEAALAYDPTSPVVNLAALSGPLGCGSDKNSVSIAFVSWK